MTIYLATEQVISIHDLESADQLRDAAALDAAVNASRATWDTHPLHPTVYEQAGVLLRDICQAQAFVNGNKRTAWISTDVFLQLNALRLADIRAEDIAALLRAGCSTTRNREHDRAADDEARRTVPAPTKETTHDDASGHHRDPKRHSQQVRNGS